MSIDLGPRDIGGVFDDAIALWKAHLRPILLAYGLVVFPVALLQTFSAAQSGMADFDSFQAIWAMQVEQVSMLALFGAADVLTSAFLIVYVGRRVVGRPWTPRACLRYTARKALILLPLFLVIFIAVTIGMCMLLIPGLVLSVFVYLVSPVIMLEDEGFVGGIRRSFSLVGRQFWQAFAVILITGLVALSAEGFAGPGTFYGIWWLLIPAAAASALTSSFSTMAKLAFYLSARSRVEHLDVDIAVRDAVSAGAQRGGAL
jgi:hypothetical protein